MRRIALSLVFAIVIVLFNAPAFAQSAKPGDIARGQDLFAKVCAVCHEVEPGKHRDSGPSLYGVVGSRVGFGEGYIYYSEALKSADFTWTVERLDGYLDDPEAFLPGNGGLGPLPAFPRSGL
ncbi:MAG: c-type cytochrome [Proteobacteria bacterium]|nr:c-type cytochrome [Pseudomonadota bacterium]